MRFALATAPGGKSHLPGEPITAHVCLYISAQVPGSLLEDSCPQLHTLTNILPLCTYKVQFLAHKFVLTPYLIWPSQIWTLKINSFLSFRHPLGSVGITEVSIAIKTKAEAQWNEKVNWWQYVLERGARKEECAVTAITKTKEPSSFPIWAGMLLHDLGGATSLFCWCCCYFAVYLSVPTWLQPWAARKHVKLLLSLGEKEGKATDIGGRGEGWRYYFGPNEPAENTDHQLLLSVTAEVSFEETAWQTWGLGSPSCAWDAAGDTTQTFKRKLW